MIAGSLNDYFKEKHEFLRPLFLHLMHTILSLMGILRDEIQSSPEYDVSSALFVRVGMG